MPHQRRRRLASALLRMTLALDDAVQAGLVRLVGSLGRREITVLPFIGYGTPQSVRVRGRVVLGRSSARPVTADLVHDPSEDAPPEGRWGAWLERWDRFREGVAPFLTVEVPRCPVVVHGPVDATSGRADRQGYLDVPVDAHGLAPGWHQVSVAASWRGRATETTLPVLVVDPEATLAVVSDLDDTVIESGITRGLEVLRLTLLTEVTKRTPLPGAAELYQALTAARDGSGPVPVFYLSTSPWNLYELLTRFLLLRGFPAGPLVLTDWGPNPTNLFRVSTEEHKLTLIRALLAEHPALRVILVGDTGQLDPEIYATIAQEAPDRVRAIYVRRTVGMPADRAVQLHGLTRRVAGCGVPMLVVEDSVQIAEHAARIGLLDAVDVRAVRAATRRHGGRDHRG
jgi:phosphatidate phosphatase APP1